MYDIIYVTNRKSCEGDFVSRVGKIAQTHPKAIILREKDLSEAEYKLLAKEVMAVCKRYNTTCILHSFTDVAIELEAKAIHLPLPILRDMSAGQKLHFEVLGASCHSLEELAEAQKLGCTYITAGHIFDTGCKAGIPGRGIEFLSDICNHADVPVYAIGGITPSNIAQITECGAQGGCIMSSIMRCRDVEEFMKDFNRL